MKIIKLNPSTLEMLKEIKSNLKEMIELVDNLLEEKKKNQKNEKAEIREKYLQTMFLSQG